jgi:integrase
MPSINFYLDKPDRKNQHPISLAYIAEGKRFRYYTKLKVLSCNWNPKTQSINKSEPGAEEMNCILESLRDTVKQIEREAIFKREKITTEKVKQRFEIAIGKQKAATDFHAVYEKYLDACKARITPRAWQAFKGAYNKLRNFERIRKYPLTFENVNKNFYDLYLDFMINECGHLNNTVGRFVKNIKFFMNYATELGLNTNLQFKKFKCFDEEADLIYLTWDELMNIFNLEITEELLYRVRENFCFECFTGLRFSDVSKVQNVHIEGTLIKITTQKTKTPIVIPLNQYALKTLERNKGKYGDKPLPPCMTLQNTNAYLKKLGKLANLDVLVHTVKYSGVKRRESTKAKHLLLTTHAARRTFITLSLEKGMRPEIVMQIVGIKKWDTFKRYIKITDMAKVIEMNAKWNDSPIFKIV